MKHRLFLGIPVSDEFKHSIQSLLPKQTQQSYIRWVPVENYHVTISFFGYIEEAQISNLQTKIETIVQRIKPFSLEFKAISLAPPKKKPTMLWAIFNQNDQFTNLVQAIEEGVGNKAEANNFRKSHAPIPHITLARFKEMKADFDIATAKNMKLEVSTCYLFESKLTQKGPIYTKIHEFFLVPSAQSLN